MTDRLPDRVYGLMHDLMQGRVQGWVKGPALALAAGAAIVGAPLGVHADVLVVRVEGVEAAGGEVRVALYADAAAFEARTAFRAATLDAAAPELELRFADVPAGEYAVLVHHDVDGDGELDRGRFGIPNEPWTGSTSGTRFRAPSWRAYAFEVPSDGLSISLAF